MLAAVPDGTDARTQLCLASLFHLVYASSHADWSMHFLFWEREGRLHPGCKGIHNNHDSSRTNTTSARCYCFSRKTHANKDGNPKMDGGQRQKANESHQYVVMPFGITHAPIPCHFLPWTAWLIHSRDWPTVVTAVSLLGQWISFLWFTAVPHAGLTRSHLLCCGLFLFALASFGVVCFVHLSQQ